MRSIITLCFLGLIFQLNGQTEANLLSTWSVDTIPGSNAFDNAYNEIWGYAADGREYAIIGSTLGTHFIDVTDPSNIEEVQFVEGAVASPQIIHRDYHDNKGYLYAVADEGSQSTLQIIDMSGLPDAVTVVYDSKEYIRRSHNIFIDPASDILYSLICGGDDIGYTPMRLFDISNPEIPTPIAHFTNIGGFEFSQVHDAFIKNDTAYMNCGPDGFCIAEFSDPTNPQLISFLNPGDYMQSGYNHSGWLDDDGETYYMADETHGMDIKVIDVSDLPDLEVVNFFNAGSEHPDEIPHNLIARNDYLYVSYYYDGLQVYDISDPQNPVRFKFFDTYLEDNVGSYHGAWGVYPLLPSGNILVSDMQSGLFVFETLEETSSDDNETIDQNLVISPNPSLGLINIESSDLKFTGSIEVYDVTGKLVQKTMNNQLRDSGTCQVDIQQASGIYMLNLALKNGSTSVSKIIIE